MTLQELGWAAGFFEGEGTIRMRGESAIELSISSTDLDVLERFRSTVGIGSIAARSRRTLPHHKPQWTWAASRTLECMALLDSLLPLLGQRRSARAREVIQVAQEARWRTCYCGKSFYSASCQRIHCSDYCAQAIVDSRRRPRKVAV